MNFVLVEETDELVRAAESAGCHVKYSRYTDEQLKAWEVEAVELSELRHESLRGHEYFGWCDS